MLLSASWQCPVCDQRGDHHALTECFVAKAAQKIRELREANYKLMEINGRLRSDSQRLPQQSHSEVSS